MKIIDKKASEHPSAGGARLTMIPIVPPKSRKKPKRAKR